MVTLSEKQETSRSIWTFRRLSLYGIMAFIQVFIVYKLVGGGWSFFSAQDGVKDAASNGSNAEQAAQYIQLQTRDVKLVLASPGIRVVLVIAAIIVLNMAAICIHHVFLKVSRATVSYKTIELNIGPY